MAKLTRQQQAEEIRRLAEESGVQENYLFTTTFDRYQVQLRILDRLEKAVDEAESVTTEKVYRGKEKNLYSNPVFTEYNRTVDSTNKTVSTLMRIIKNFNVGDDGGEKEDPLMRIVNGGSRAKAMRDDDDDEDESDN